MPLLISTSVDAATVTIRPVGDIDLATEPALAAALDKAIGTDGSDTIVVDLSGTAFMDCFGMSALIHARRAAAERDMKLRVHGADGLPLLVLRITGVWEYLAGS
jgi:anti-sigma B factor antagonist